MKRPIAAALPMVLLAACGGDDSIVDEDDGRTASGEVLEGSISDEMIPLERLESQPPLLRERTAPATAEDGEETDEGPGEPPEGFLPEDATE
ncbi:MAG TPA: hypothetical protein VLA37_11755 [Sphingomonadaceae bacterium]|nr:hypothetical protein [Sphingomonadaceae bacterium]